MRLTKNGKNLEETYLSIKPSDIKRGEIWRVNFDPTVGTEIKKLGYLLLTTKLYICGYGISKRPNAV